MSARRRQRDELSDDEDRPARRSVSWYKDVQQQQRTSGKVLADVEVTPRRSTGASSQPSAPQQAPATEVATAPSATVKKLFQGLIAAAPAPFSVSGALIADAVTTYVKAIKEDGVAAVHVNSLVAAECNSLSVQERIQITEKFLKEGVPVCVHVTSPSLADTIVLAKHAQSSGATAISVSVPTLNHYPTSLEDALDFINEVSHAASTIPLLIEYHGCHASYSLSELVSAATSRGLLVNLRGAITYSADMSDLAAALALKGSITDVISGCDSSLAAAAFHGATAFVGREFSFLGPLYAKLIASAQKGDASGTQQLQGLLSRFQGMIRRIVGNSECKRSAASKALVSLRCCVDFGPVRPPGTRLTVHELTRLSDEFAEFIKVYAAQVKPAVAPRKNIKTMDGYNGRLNGKIQERIRELEPLIGVRNIMSFFPHLAHPDGSWRKNYPTEESCNPARHIDHTLLKAEGTRKEISVLCEDAIKNNFYAVCVNGSRVAQCVDELRGSGVKVAAVIGFPLGAGTSKAKAREARELIEIGAKEIDMVMNIGAMKDGNYRLVYEDVKAVVDASAPGIVKVIFETCLLSSQEIIDASILCVAAGAQFIKTSTGFNKDGATPEGLDIMLAVAGNEAEVKAAGGVRDFATAASYISSGVSRIGTSSGVAIISGKPVGSGY